jgi:RNA polymerase sigma-70 factor, ECF subfamily
MAAVKMDAPAPGTASASLATALMLRVAQADGAAFTQLVRLLERPALALAYRTLQDRAGAEDVCQQAFARLWTHAVRFDPARGSADAWFRRILVNLCLDRRRSLRPVQALDDAAEIADAGPDPETAAIRADEQARLEQAMARLNPRQRLALALFHGEGQSMAEIAEVMETTAKAVEGLLGRARIELRTLMTESLPT